MVEQTFGCPQFQQVKFNHRGYKTVWSWEGAMDSVSPIISSTLAKFWKRPMGFCIYIYIIVLRSKLLVQLEYMLCPMSVETTHRQDCSLHHERS